MAAESYLRAASRLGDWVIDHVHDPDGGYTGGFEGWEPTPKKLTWKSTEHNLDLYVAFMTLNDVSPDSKWHDHALHAKAFVRSMWEACGDSRFATGTDDDGLTPNCDFAPVDVNTWGLLALGEFGIFGGGFDWVLTNARVEEPCGSRRPAVGGTSTTTATASGGRARRTQCSHRGRSQIGATRNSS